MSQNSKKIELQQKIGQLSSKLKNFCTQLTDKNPDTGGLRLFELESQPLFNEEGILEIQKALEEIGSIKSELEETEESGTENIKALLDEIDIDGLHDSIGYNKPFYMVVTFDQEARTESYADEYAETGTHNDNIDRCAEYGSDRAIETFSELTRQHESEIDKIVKEFEKASVILQKIASL